ncbi:MAG: putative quinol monooxygenase [Planctomycetota bacterium]
MTRFALLVTLRVKPGTAGEFLPHILAAAEAAVREEPDCHQFHVSQDEDDADTFFLYELYTDAAALEFHHKQPHFLKLHEQAGHLIVDKSRSRLTVHNG